MALMCLSQPEFSRPHRKSLMDGDLISPTARKWASDKGKEEKETQRDQVCIWVVTPTQTHTHMPPLTIDNFLLAAPHHMNVLNADEQQLDVGVVVLVLIAFPRCSVGHGIQLFMRLLLLCTSAPFSMQPRLAMKSVYLGPGVHHVYVITARVGFHQGLHHHLILLTSSAEAWQRLTAAADCSLRRSSASLAT